MRGHRADRRVSACGCRGLRGERNSTSVEPIIAMQARALAEHGTLYYDMRSYPYTVCAYMPSFYFLEAGLYRLGVPLLQAGRLISLSAFLAILWLLFRTIELYTGDKDAAWDGRGSGGPHSATRRLGHRGANGHAFHRLRVCRGLSVLALTTC